MNPCKKCLVKPMCLEMCDELDEWWRKKRRRNIIIVDTIISSAIIIAAATIVITIVPFSQLSWWPK